MSRARPNRIPALTLAGLVALWLGPAHAQTDDFYKGKTINLYVGFTPGGGYDINARLLAAYMARYIPGKPNIVVQNMPGAGSLTAVRALDATLPKDGTAITTFNSGLTTQSIVEPDKVQVDFRSLAWVGTITADFRVCYGFGPNGVKSWDDMMKRKEFILGSTAKGAGNYINGAILRQVFNAPVRQILGFPGSAEQRIAVERGELDGDCGSFSSIPQNWLDERKVHPFVRFMDRRPPEIPESATFIGHFAETDEQKALLNVLTASDEVGRPFIVSKQVPRERLAILRNAFNAAMKDKDFVAEAEKQKQPVNPLTGDEAEQVIARMSNVSPAIVAKAKAIYE